MATEELHPQLLPHRPAMPSRRGQDVRLYAAGRRSEGRTGAFQTAPTTGSLSQTTAASVSNDGTLRPVLGGEPVANDGTLLIYQSARSPREDGPRANDGEAAQHANIANLPRSSPRWVEITPEIDEALNRVLDGRSRLGLPAPVDALTEIEGLILSKTLTHGSAVREAVH